MSQLHPTFVIFILSIASLLILFLFGVLVSKKREYRRKQAELRAEEINEARRQQYIRENPEVLDFRDEIRQALAEKRWNRLQESLTSEDEREYLIHKFQVDATFSDLKKMADADGIPMEERMKLIQNASFMIAGYRQYILDREKSRFRQETEQLVQREKYLEAQRKQEYEEK